MPVTPIVTKILSVLTVTANVLIAVFLLLFVYKHVLNKKFRMPAFITRNSLLFAFIVALIATSGSLFYSEIAGFEPCKFCWFQRIFMYPLVLLLGIALYKKAKNIYHYVVPMSVIGGLISAYHYYVQRSVYASSCGADAVVSCTVKYTFTFGYITIPMMALSAFVLIIIFMRILKKKGG